MRTPTVILLALGAWLAATSCGIPIRGGGYLEAGAEMGRYASFDWDETSDSESGESRLENTPSFEPTLHQAVERKLSERGIHRSRSAPDLLVHHHLSVAEHEMVTEAVRESGYTETEVRRYEEGTVVVHLVDAGTGENVWLGWAQAEIAAALHGGDAMDRWVERLVSKMFESWETPSGDGGG